MQCHECKHTIIKPGKSVVGEKWHHFVQGKESVFCPSPGCFCLFPAPENKGRRILLTASFVSQGGRGTPELSSYGRPNKALRKFLSGLKSLGIGRE